VMISSAAGAAGAGIGAYALLSIAAIWKPLSDYSPAGLPGQAASLAVHLATPSSLWPVISSLLLSVALVVLAAVLFRRKEL
jgi:ABC-2 type transport system permease protein